MLNLRQGSWAQTALGYGLIGLLLFLGLQFSILFWPLLIIILLIEAYAVQGRYHALTGAAGPAFADALNMATTLLLSRCVLAFLLLCAGLAFTLSVLVITALLGITPEVLAARADVPVIQQLGPAPLVVMVFLAALFLLVIAYVAQRLLLAQPLTAHDRAVRVFASWHLTRQTPPARLSGWRQANPQMIAEMRLQILSLPALLMGGGALILFITEPLPGVAHNALVSAVLAAAGFMGAWFGTAYRQAYFVRATTRA